MARSPDDPYNRATSFGRRVYDSANSGKVYDHDWLADQLEKAVRTKETAAGGASTFEEQYEELFGEKLDYDPIDTRAPSSAPPSPRLNLTGRRGGAPVDSEPDEIDKLYESYLTSERAAPPEDNAFGEDTVRRLGAGTASTGAMATGALEYGARQARRGMEEPSVYSEMLDDVIGGLGGMRQSMTAQAQEWRSGISPESLERQQRHILTLDPNQSVWRGSPMEVLDSLAGKVTESLPATVLTLLPAARWFRNGMTPAAVTYLGASEAGISIGDIANGTAQDIEGMSDEQLNSESERYRQLLEEGGDPEQARQALIAEAQGAAPLIAGVLVGVISSTAGRFLEPVFQKGAGLAARTGMGVAEEAVQEGPQSAVEQYASNVAAQVYDADRKRLAGVGEAAAEGAVVGGISGGGFSAVLGGGREDAVADPAKNTQPAREAESFESVFGENQDNGFLESPPGYVKGGGDSLVQIVEPGGVTPEIRAALEQGGQRSMYLPQPGELEEMGRQGGLPGMAQGPRREPVVRPPNPLAVPGGQQQLPLKRRVRGGMEGIEPPPAEATDYSADMSTPPGAAQDPRQQDFVTPSPRGLPDSPSAEPMLDIQAQLDEMDRPEATEREAVYLSADNLAQLERAGDLPAILERGVPLANFDGKGGLLIARDREVAQALVDLRNQGGDMQELLGTATGAGQGKPGGAGITVQRRQNGAVVQESLVADEAEADRLTQEWETKYPNDEVAVLSAPAAIGRRKRLLQQEGQKRLGRALADERQQDQDRTSQRVRQATAITPDDGPAALLSSRSTARRVAAGATSPTKAAARMLGQAARESAKPEQQRVGGYYPPDSLDFKDPTEAVRYRNRFSNLTDLELEHQFGERELEAATEAIKAAQAEESDVVHKKGENFKDMARRQKEFQVAKRDRITAARKKHGEVAKRVEANKKARGHVQDELHEIRTRAKPVRRAAHLVAAAQRLAPEAVKKVLSESERNATRDPEDDISKPEVEVDTAELGRLTDPQIDALDGKQLNEMFDRAASWLSGRVPEGVEITMGFTPATEGHQEQFAKKEAGKREFERIRGAELIEVLQKRHPSPSLKRKLIRRVKNMVIGQAHGGRTQSKPITASATSMKSRPDIQRRKGKFETQVLAADVLPQDEARGDRIKREQQAKRSRERLDKTTRRAFEHLDKLSSGKFAEQAQERDGEELSDSARDLIYGRSYFRTLVNFAEAMVRSGNKSATIIAEMEKVNEFLHNAIGMSAKDFARVMGNLLRAESQTQASELRNFGDYKNKLADPAKREKLNADILDELLAAAASLSRLARVRQNPYYRSIVEPMILKFTDSTFRDGWPSYKPSEQEMVKLHWVLNNWRNGELRAKFYTPIRRFFTNIGFEWTPTKKLKDGTYTGGELVIPYDKAKYAGRGAPRYKYSPSDRALRPLFVKKFGVIDELGTGLSFEGSHHVNSADLKGKPKMPPGAVMGLPSGRRVEKLGRLLQANRVIAKFREIIKKPKTTVAGMIRTEERLVRAFKELGMWTQTGPLTGTVRFQTTSQSYRLVGPRLTSKELSKEEGRKLLLQQMKRQPVSDAAFMDNLAVQKIANEPLRSETEMFLDRVADPGPGIAEFRKVALRINEILDEGHRVHTLGELLPLILDGIPETHMFHNLTQKLLSAGIADTPISWDTRGQLRRMVDGKEQVSLGTAKWETDPRAPNGRFRYIILNRTDINSRREPGATLLHVLLHEATHIATSGAIDRSRPIQQAFQTLKLLAARFLHNEGGKAWEDLPYGLHDHHDVDEFVAEAYSNPRFQALLKRIPMDYSKTLWGRFVELVKDVLGVSSDRPEPRNAFEAVMSLESHIFTGQDRVLGGVASEMRKRELHMLDDTVRPAAAHVLDTITETGQTLKRGWARALSPNAPLIMMTMRQLHKEFRRHYGVGKNSFDRYHENWERRNAENSRLMELGEAVSRDWSAATEKTSAADALEFSRILTEATLGGIHPDRAVNAVGNEHVKLGTAKARHAELSARFNALPAEWTTLYKRLLNYYTDTLQQETNLLMLNALRGTLASGDNAVMSRSDFDKKYTEESVRSKQLFTQEGLEREFGGLDKSMVRTLQEIASIPTKREGPYFPLMRYGNFVVFAQKAGPTKTFADSKQAYAHRAQLLAEDPTLDVSVSKGKDDRYAVYTTERDFQTAESRTEAEQLKQEMITLYGREAVTDVQLKDNFKVEETIQSGSALSGILTNLKGNVAAQNAIKNYWLRSLADRSFRKHQIRRKNRRGVDFDLQHRSFTNYVKQASYYISQLKFGWRMADAFRDLQKFVKDSRDTHEITSVRLGQVRDELRKRDEMTHNLDEMPKVIRTATELGQLFMLFGPSYWLINTTQPYMVTLPWLSARYGIGGATAALANAQKQILHPILRAGKDSFGGLKAYFSKVAAEKAFNVLEQVKETIKQRGGDRADAYIDMLEQLRQQSVIDLSWIAELRDISEGRSTSGYQRFMDSTRVMAHLTEVNNRIITALAAYDLRYSEVMARQGATHALAHNAAVQTAKDAVAETQFDYSGGNKARLFSPGGPLGKASPLVFQFMQYSQHMYAMMISNFATAVRRGDMDRATAAKTLAGLFATHAAMAGALGIALQPLKWAIGMMLWGLGDDDEPYTFANAASGENFDRWARAGLADVLGNKLGSVVAQGLPELAGVRLTDRMSLGTVYYLDLKTDTAESTIGSVAQGFMGPVLGYGFTAARASQFALEGEYLQALMTLSPKALRDVRRAWQFETQGLVNNAGDTVIKADELSPTQVFMQAMGFRPSEIADFYAKQSYVKEKESIGTDRRELLLKRFRTAETIDERNAVLREAAEFSRHFPAQRITRSAMLRALAGKREREQSYGRYGVSLRGRSRIYGDDGDFYDTE